MNLCNVVPAGIVAFLPSYNFEELVYKHLDKSGIIAKISAKKRIFREPKLTSQVLLSFTLFSKFSMKFSYELQIF